MKATRSPKDLHPVSTQEGKALSSERPVSLIRVLVQLGVAPRRTLTQWIQQGQVSVDGVVAYNLSAPVDPKVQRITIDGKPIPKAPKKVYFMLHKPKGYVCSHKDDGKKVVDLFKELGLKLVTVGRLDRDTTGLLLVTNDGDFCQSIAHPSNEIAKEYLVKVNKEVEDHHLKAISQGTLVEGHWVKPLRVTKVRRGSLKVVVTDGRKHEVKHLMRAADLEVVELSRIRIGGLQLGSLPVGAYKPLMTKEKEAIFH